MAYKKFCKRVAMKKKFGLSMKEIAKKSLELHKGEICTACYRARNLVHEKRKDYVTYKMFYGE